ncbi:MAG: hypothetical protein AB1916_16730 [Thermodesulfobacteriota bacterium]
MSEADVAKALGSGNPDNPVAVEVKRMSDAIVAAFKAEVKRTGRYPGGMFALQARCPIEASAISAASDILEKLL